MKAIAPRPIVAQHETEDRCNPRSLRTLLVGRRSTASWTAPANLYRDEEWLAWRLEPTRANHHPQLEGRASCLVFTMLTNPKRPSAFRFARSASAAAIGVVAGRRSSQWSAN